MKKMKKLVSLLLTFAMVIAMAVSVSAASTDYTITISDSTSGHTYEAYQIFAGDLSGDASDGYVLSNIVWGSGIDSSKTTNLMTALTSLTVNGSQPFSGCSSAKDVAEVLGSSGNNTTDSAVAKAFADIVGQYLSTTCVSSTQSASTYTISVSTPGYYLVKDKDASLNNAEGEAYTRFILEVVADVTATPKKDTPTVEKKVYEESYTSTDAEKAAYGAGYNDVADYDIGDAVPFELIGTMPSNLSDYTTYKYIFHDTMDGGLTFDSTSVVVKIGSTTVPATYGTTTNYTVSTSATDGCTFEVQFTDVLSLVDSTGTSISVTKDSKIVVSYNATLNSNAVIGLDGNVNKVLLEYSNNPNTGGEGDTGKTPEDKNIVFTYELDVTKTNGTETTATKLKDAEFILYKTVSGTNYYAKVTNEKITGWTTAETEASTLASDTDGLFKVAGLDDGTYYLKETKAPTGYNLLSSPVKLDIVATTVNGQNWGGTASAALTALTISVDGGTVTSGTLSTGVVSATVVNNAGSSLPETGGMGTTILYVIGTILVLGAAILLVTKKRMSSER